MKHRDLNTSNIIDIMLEEMPELQKSIEDYKEYNDLTLLHNVFAFVFNPFLKENLIPKYGKKTKNLGAKNYAASREKNPQLLKRIFIFLERMASSSDFEIRNILGVTIIESLSPKQLDIFLEYAGPRTKIAYSNLEEYLELLFKR